VVLKGYLVVVIKVIYNNDMVVVGALVIGLTNSRNASQNVNFVAPSAGDVGTLSTQQPRKNFFLRSSHKIVPGLTELNNILEGNSYILRKSRYSQNIFSFTMAVAV
jgi:hypothetical protein